MMQAQMGMGAGAAAAQQFNAQAAYRKVRSCMPRGGARTPQPPGRRLRAGQERDSLRLCQYKDVTAEAEQRLIAAFRASS